ncbi:helix-turn-helix domain-containing protein [Geobacter benzoatilyticus]|uniref:Helix-turn-helix domain-containing protein n=1 Tax=Geobacter benzoatilyticus TaxID=2815309 RepID=A0ABX7Q0R5_9BACT|nr:helix-turn-helix domain-containing protein [Geobacter benzoatilyticus]QSV44997.1 helix-turn-helix domain-containing protein [Geobacter benzoatilyticus]
MENAEFCALVGMMADYLTKHPKDGAERLREFLGSGDKLLSTDDVMELTGWSRAHVVRLCKQGFLPHIPSNPHKFLRGPLMQALHELQRGGVYGRQKTRTKTTRTKKGA